MPNRNPNRGVYHGRNRAPSLHVPKWLLIGGGILLAFCLFLLILAIWLQRYMVYSETGGELVLPWETPSSQSAPAEEPPAVVEETGSAPYTSNDLRAVELSVSDLLAGKADAVLRESGANALIVEMKAAAGTLYWSSGNALAQSLDVIAPESGDVSAALADLKSRGVTLIAKVNCFRDNTLGGAEDYALHDRNGALWSDGGCYWADPENETVQDYLAALVQELPGLGFDEILLTGAGYPTEGHLELLPQRDFSAMSAVLAAFYEKAGAFSGESRPVLSIEADTDTVTRAESAVSGQSVSLLLHSGQRVWVAADGETDLTLVFTSEELLRGALVLEVKAFDAANADLAQGILLG